MGNNQPRIIRLPARTLANNEELRVVCTGCNMFRVRSATADFSVRFNGGMPIKISSGMSVTFDYDLETVTLVNDSGAGNTVDIIISDAEIRDDALTVSAPLVISSITAQVSIVRAANHDAKADVSINAATTTQIMTSSSSTRDQIIKNPASNFYPFRIGSSAAASGVGFELSPGESLLVNCKGGLYAYNTAPYAQTITISRTTD